ncbi:MAG: carbohydrate-binding family 9-like protein [Victivallaceae bacterium]
MKVSMSVIAAAFLLMTVSASGAESDNSNAGAAVIAKYTSEPVKIDGKLDEGAWAKAPAYSLALPLKAYSSQPESMQKTVGTDLREKASVKLLWDDNYLYVGAQLEDSDVMNEGKEDQGHLYTTGDLLEIFLKPAAESYYWEIYGSPNNKKTWFFFPSRGRIVFPACASYLPKDLQAAASVDGTLNNFNDKDKGFTIEMAIPVKELTAYGAKFDNSANWTILMARYNYSVYFTKPELSAYPLLSNVNFHICEEYAKLLLEK